MSKNGNLKSASQKKQFNKQIALQPVVLGYIRPKKLIDDILVTGKKQSVFRRQKLVLVL